MKPYSFDDVPDRSGTCSYKWDEPGVLPMWVADMDFPVAPAIEEAIQKRAAHPIFGYTEAPKEFFDAYISFYHDLYSFNIKREEMIFAWGVVPIISSSVRAFTKPGEKIAVFSPVYHVFFHSIENNGRIVEEIPLKKTGTHYDLPYEEIEKAFSDPSLTMCIFCNPHNPVGRVWSLEELRRLEEIALKHNVLILSDEIHGPLTDPDILYHPFYNCHEESYKNVVTALSPTKAFNLAGIQTAMSITRDKNLRDRLAFHINCDEVGEGNAFSYLAPVAAYNDSRDWLLELRKYLKENKDLVREYLEKEIPEFKLGRNEATYLLWIDVSALGIDSDAYYHLLEDKCSLRVSPGSEFRGEGHKFIRLNIATSKKNVLEGLHRLKHGADIAKSKASN